MILNKLIRINHQRLVIVVDIATGFINQHLTYSGFAVEDGGRQRAAGYV